MNRYSLSSLLFSVHLVTPLSSCPDRLSGTATVSTRTSEPASRMPISRSLLYLFNYYKKNRTRSTHKTLHIKIIKIIKA